jgi:hypothetical protein
MCGLPGVNQETVFTTIPPGEPNLGSARVDDATAIGCPDRFFRRDSANPHW